MKIPVLLKIVASELFILFLQDYYDYCILFIVALLENFVNKVKRYCVSSVKISNIFKVALLLLIYILRILILVCSGKEGNHEDFSYKHTKYKCCINI